MKNHDDLLTPEKRLLMDSHHEHKIQALVSHLLLLPPATKLGQGYVFTRVCDSVHRGVSAPVHAGIHTLMGRYTPRVDTLRTRGRHPPGRSHPSGRHPPGQTPPRQTPPGQTPPLRSACWDTVNKQAVCILLECNLVYICFFRIQKWTMFKY